PANLPSSVVLLQKSYKNPYKPNAQKQLSTLNNEASDFTTMRRLPNTLGPLKKPLHTLSAAIIE
ncbi:MAG: hypothetical protein QXR22_03185, partial [Acidilobaceae archaeon]